MFKFNSLLVGDGRLIDLRLFLLATFVKLEELVTLVEFFFFIFFEESACMQTVPLGDQDLEVCALYTLNLELTEIEKVRHEITMREHHAFVSELIEPRMGQCIDWSNTLPRLIDK